jgi:hypothetical protein
MVLCQDLHLEGHLALPKGKSLPEDRASLIENGEKSSKNEKETA